MTVDYSDLGFPVPTSMIDPFDEDGYCEFCGNGHWKFHAPWCVWADIRDAVLHCLLNWTV